MSLGAPSDVELVTVRDSTPPAYRLRDVNARVETRRVLQDLSLSLGPHRTTVILGPGGSGKSTLLRVLADAAPPSPDLHVPDEVGTGEFELPPAFDWDGDCQCGLASVAWMAQRHSLRKRLVALELAVAWRLPYDLQGIEEARRQAAQVWNPVSGAWDQLRTMMNKNFGDLSPGQQRLVDLTRVAAGEPDCLLLDEPTAEQSPAEEDLVVQLLESLRSRATLVVVTHNVRVARLLADDLILLIEGEVAEAGPLQQIVKSPRHPRTEFFLRMGC